MKWAARGLASRGRGVDTGSGWDSGEVLTEGLIDSLFAGEIGVDGAFLSFLSREVWVDDLSERKAEV